MMCVYVFLISYFLFMGRVYVEVEQSVGDYHLQERGGKTKGVCTCMYV